MNGFRRAPLASSRARAASHLPRLALAGLCLWVSGQLWAIGQQSRAVRALAGALHVLGSMEMFGAALSCVFVLVGRIELPDLMDRPERSSSLREFWGNRWNCVVQQSLHYYVYQPLKQRGCGKPACALATFAASGLLHSYPMWVAGLDWWACLSMMSYFLAQAGLLMLETRLFPAGTQSGKQPSLGSSLVARRIWVFSCLIGPLTLAVEPVYNLFA